MLIINKLHNVLISNFDSSAIIFFYSFPSENFIKILPILQVIIALLAIFGPTFFNDNE